ncbi:MAG: FRG domain-containing protein [Lachnospiraceae bacterium]|nr:FRG domain-containing protein [Lachnospiraceae bacterium]
MEHIQMVHNLGELIEIIDELSQKEVLWYRGHADKEWELIPSVQRQEFIGKEQNLANDFYMKASVTLRDKPDFRNYSAWLSIMRHYGLPTRLLDWSRSPLIAAYFATENWGRDDKDGCIWIISPSKLNAKEGFEEYLYSIDSHTALQMIRPAFKKEYEPENKRVIDKILACYPIEHDMRIYVQQSAFTLHNTERKLVDIEKEGLLQCITIPWKAKERIAYELNIMGISLSHVYPDAQNIAAELVYQNQIIGEKRWN